MGIVVSSIEDEPESEQRPWADLPHNVLFLIYQRLGVIEILLAAQGVCTSWRKLARDPKVWRCIDLRFIPRNLNDCHVEKLTYEAVKRSKGFVEEFYAGGFIWDDTFTYISNRTTGLRNFALVSPRGFTKERLMEFMYRYPLLEEIEITNYSIFPEVLMNIGRACPMLKRFGLNNRFTVNQGRDLDWDTDRNCMALEIANNLPQLLELQLIGNPMTNKGLEAIVDKCVRLQSLDIRACYNVFVGSGLKAKLDKIKMVRLPYQYKDPKWGKADWEELPRDVFFLIFQKLGAIEVLLAAQAVCTSWRQIALDPQFWRCIDLRLNPIKFDYSLLEKLTCEAVDRCDGIIEEFYAEGSLLDDVYTYFSNRTTGMRSIYLISSHSFTKRIMEFICQYPLLEELNLTFTSFCPEVCRNIGQACPKLKRLGLNRMRGREGWYSNYESDREATEIANNMPQLRELQLMGNSISNKGLRAIVDKCLHLESLDVLGCHNLRVRWKKGSEGKLRRVHIFFLRKQ